jgi:hypothetical protein
MPGIALLVEALPAVLQRQAMALPEGQPVA